MRQIFLATTALSLSLALAACNDDKGGTDNSSTFNELNQKIDALDSAQQQNKATIDGQNQEIAALKQARADDTAAFETRIAAVVKAVDEKPDISPELEARLVALQEQIGKIPAFETADEFEAFKQELKDLRTELDKAPKTAKVAELSDSLAALSDKFASATDFKEVENYVDGVKTKLDALLAAADPELLKTLKDTLAGLRTDLTGKTTFTDEDIKGFTDRIAALEQLVATKAAKPDIIADGLEPSIAPQAGDFALKPQSRIVTDSVPAEVLTALTAEHGWVQKLRYATGYKLPLVEGAAPTANDIVLSGKPDQSFLEAAQTTVLKVQSGGKSTSKSISQNVLKEGYQYDFGSKGAIVEFAGARGGINGFVTLTEKIMGDGNPAGKHRILAQASGTDYPAFEERIVMLDVGRLYMPVDQIIGYMEKMSLFKLNVLHIHFQEDRHGRPDETRYDTAALRICSPDYPELEPKFGGCYHKADWERLEKAAERYGIVIIPEFEGPGHSMSWLNAKPELPFFDHDGYKTLDVRGDDITKIVGYIGGVINHFRPWFKSGIVHIGGDESPDNGVSNVVRYVNALYDETAKSDANPDGFSDVRIWHENEPDYELATLNPAIGLHHFGTLFGAGQQSRKNIDYVIWYFYYIAGYDRGNNTNSPAGLFAKKAEEEFGARLAAYVEGKYIPDGVFLGQWNDKAVKYGYTPDMINGGMTNSLPVMGGLTWRGPRYAPDGKRLMLQEADLKKQIPVSQELSSTWVRERFPYLNAGQALNILMDNARHRKIDPTSPKFPGRDGMPKDQQYLDTTLAFKQSTAAEDFLAWDTEDMGRAFAGPRLFRDGEMFVADLPGEGQPFILRPDVICHDPAFVAASKTKSRCDEDTWSNDIVAAPVAAGKVSSGGLLKLGRGKLVLNGNNTYTGDTVIEGGTLEVNGALVNSKVSIKRNGKLTGTGLSKGGLVLGGG